MRTSQPFAKGPYWRVVKQCLIDFHHTPSTVAEREIREYRSRLKAVSGGSEPDILYHEEPFVLACEIAGADVSPDPHRLEYERMVKQLLTTSSTNKDKHHA